VSDRAFTEVASGLEFPEGPVAMADGSLVVVEVFGERVTRIDADGVRSTVAEVAGGPNGLAPGPDGCLVLCNNGGTFTPVSRRGLLLPGPFDLDRYHGGLVQRIDPDGTVSDLYTNCGGRPLRGPNDLVLDAHGGFYFTDHGIVDEQARTADLSAIYYARCDGSDIHEVAFPAHSPNGIGLSPDGETLYYAETYTGRIFRRRVVEPGVLAPTPRFDPSTLLHSVPGMRLLDSLAVDGEGWVCVGTLLDGGITSVSPDGSSVEFVATDDPFTTNLCFGGPDLRTAYVTLSATGRVVSLDWPRGGARLAHR
jgi:gluconolactonase